MARGRIIAKEICLDKAVNDLNDAWSMLAFTWLIPHLDCEGRTYGDPAIVKSMVFPRRADVTIEQMEKYITDWHNAGLIVRYEIDGDQFIEFPNFSKHQPGLVKTRETPSNIPARVLHEDCMSNACNTHAEVKLIEVNRSLSEDEDEVKAQNAGSSTFSAVWLEYTAQKTNESDWNHLRAIQATPDDLREALIELNMAGKHLPASPDRCVQSVQRVVSKRVLKKPPDDYRRYVFGENAKYVNV